LQDANAWILREAQAVKRQDEQGEGERRQLPQGFPMSSHTAQELIRVEEEWNRAMVQNDAGAIGRYMAAEWTIIDADGRVSDKTTFLGLVESGALTHDVMESDDVNVRVYGDAAVFTARAVSGGKYRGQPFRVVERVSDVFVRQDGQWRCVLTHLSRIASPGGQ
jgi:ketosteroid isomerase-like protein